MEKEKFNIRVYGLLINAENQILISDEEVKGIRFSKFPGGGLEFGEGLIDGLKREFMEECDLQIEVLAHFFTTDFFIASAFGDGKQLIAVYYFVKPIKPMGFKISDKLFDFDVQSVGDKQSFRWVNLALLAENTVTFPVDKHVVKLLKKKFL
ncbi:MAG TPA: NUDIX domain-containing protein [Pelobium sp.]